MTFVSQAALDAGLGATLGVDKELLPVKNTRGGISQGVDDPQFGDAADRGRPGDL